MGLLQGIKDDAAIAVRNVHCVHCACTRARGGMCACVFPSHWIFFFFDTIGGLTLVTQAACMHTVIALHVVPVLEFDPWSFPTLAICLFRYESHCKRER